MKNNELIARVIREGIVEADGYRYVCYDWETGTGMEHEVVRINLADLHRQYEEEGKSADEITGWEKVVSIVETF